MTAFGKIAKSEEDARTSAFFGRIAERFEERVKPFDDGLEEDTPEALGKFCWHYVKEARGSLLLMTALNAGVALGEVFLFGFVGRVVDWLHSTGSSELTTPRWAAIAAAGLLLVVALPLLNTLLSLVMFQSLFANLTMRARWQMHRRLSTQSVAFFANEMAGRVANRLMQSALAIRQAVWRLLEALVRMLAYVIGAVGLLAAADPRLVMPILVWSAVYIAVLKICIPRMRKAAAVEAGARSMMTGRIVDSYSNISTVKLFAHTKAEARYVREGMEEGLLRNRQQMRTVTVVTSLVYFNNCVLVFAIGALSLLLWRHGQITVGAIAAGLALALRLNQLSQSIMWETSGFFENIGTIIDAQSMLCRPIEGKDRLGAPNLHVRRGQIVFDKLDFGYRPTSPVLRNLSLLIRPGERVGIVGRSGAGKTTMMNLLLRLYEPPDGTIRIDDQDIRQVNQESLREAIGVVAQETSLLNRSLRENIAIGRVDATDNEIRTAAERAQALEFIERLEDSEGRRGLEAHVGERGIILSGGQRQRILLSRIFLKDAPILVLDEATSSLDSSAEAVIQDQLFDLMRGKTVVAIAHRLSTIKAMDRLLVLDDGRIVAQGSHDDLMLGGGLYADLWALNPMDSLDPRDMNQTPQNLISRSLIRPYGAEGWARNILLMIILAFSSSALRAQRTGENAVLAADDAYGTSLGQDTIGIYRTTWVRGFSPITAGNARIDGLYFDPVWIPSQRISSATKIRVGLSALSFPHPAPTGVLDFQFRRPSDRRTVAMLASADSFGAYSFESDMSFVVPEAKLSIGVGLAGYRKVFHNGTRAVQFQESVAALWRPSADIEIMPFVNRSDDLTDEVGPIYIPAGKYLPPRIKRGRRTGPSWADDRGGAANYGLLGRMVVSSRNAFRLGLFRSFLDNYANFSNIVSNVTADGFGTQTIIADPRAKTASTSGELRWSLSRKNAATVQHLDLSLRARERTRTYGGSDTVNLGIIPLNGTQRARRPTFDFDRLSRDRVDQAFIGAAYDLQWRGRLEVSAGVQYGFYRKRSARPGLAPSDRSSKGLIWNGALAFKILPSLTAYTTYSRGLEEGGVAPATAANKDESAPAIETKQIDAGLRWAITDRLRAIAAVFEIQKPQYTTDADNIWRNLGTTRNRGLEFSLSGEPVANVNVVAGAAFIRSRVIGEGVELGRFGRVPVDVPKITALAKVDWKIPGSSNLSVNFGANYTSASFATLDDQVRIPAKTLLDAGIRYRFRLAQKPAVIRFQVSNLTNVYGFTVRSPGVYGLLPGRLVTLSLATDR